MLFLNLVLKWNPTTQRTGWWCDKVCSITLMTPLRLNKSTDCSQRWWPYRSVVVGLGRVERVSKEQGKAITEEWELPICQIHIKHGLSVFKEQFKAAIIIQMVLCVVHTVHTQCTFLRVMNFQGHGALRTYLDGCYVSQLSPLLSSVLLLCSHNCSLDTTRMTADRKSNYYTRTMGPGVHFWPAVVPTISDSVGHVVSVLDHRGEGSSEKMVTLGRNRYRWDFLLLFSDLFLERVGTWKCVFRTLRVTLGILKVLS